MGKIEDEKLCNEKTDSVLPKLIKLLIADSKIGGKSIYRNNNIQKLYKTEPDLPTDETEQQELYRALVNVREPKPISEEILELEDKYLQLELAKRGITTLEQLKPISVYTDKNNDKSNDNDTYKIYKNIYVWQGDITALAVDGIVNAANSQMLGCFIPNHRCIDNAIHTFAGMRLRLVCDEIMNRQNKLEKTGKAKITPAFNLPSKYVIHTVGPIIFDAVTDEKRRLLKECYKSCLEIALKNGLKSIAFCCISTGEFRFPNIEAAKIAIDTVKEYLKKPEYSDFKVVFNVFKDIDFEIYENMLK